jgi:hypothetical protein
MSWPLFDLKALWRAAAVTLAAIMLTACAGSNVVADKARRFDQASAAFDAGDYPSAYSIWSTLAAENDLAAMRNTAHMLRRGLGVEKNLGRALDLYTEAARKGLVLAMANAAEMHMNGEGTLKDPEEAAQWYTLAANGGLSIAMVRLAEMYEQGNGVKKDPGRARELYERAAKNGYAPAMERTASAPPVPTPAPAPAQVQASAQTQPETVQAPLMREPSPNMGGLRTSSPVIDEQDRRTMSREVQRPAFARTPLVSLPPLDQAAMAGLGQQDAEKLQAGWVAYQAGQMRDALKLWRSLADKGVPDAQFRVGGMFEQGLGVNRDMIEAYRWYRLAAARNYASAQSGAARVAAQLSPAEKAIAESMAASPQHWQSRDR